MRYNLARYRGAIYQRCLVPEQIPPGVVDDAINGGLSEVLSRARAAGNRRAGVGEWTVPIVSGERTYTIPDACGEVLSIDRRLGSTWVPIWSLSPTREADGNEVEQLTYTPRDGRRFRLTYTPSSTDSEIRIQGAALYVALTRDDQEPIELPGELHEPALGAILTRASQSEAVVWAKGRDVQSFIARMDGLLVQLLTPVETDERSGYIVDESENF